MRSRALVGGLFVVVVWFNVMFLWLLWLCLLLRGDVRSSALVELDTDPGQLIPTWAGGLVMACPWSKFAPVLSSWLTQKWL
jgi:hypothetical protein